MDKNSSNQEIKKQEPALNSNLNQEKDSVKTDSIPLTLNRNLYQEKDSAKIDSIPLKQDSKPIIGVRHTIFLPPRNLDFIPVIDQPCLPPSPFFYPIPVFPTNLPTYLQFYSSIKREMIFSKDYYEKMKDYFHPRLHSFIENYLGADEDLFMLPPYHGCGLKSRNGTKKMIDYRNGQQCLFPTWPNGKDNSNDSCHRPFTRYISFSGKDRVLFKNKGNTIFNYSTNQYDHLLDTPDQDNFKRFLQVKDIYFISKQK